MFSNELIQRNKDIREKINQIKNNYNLNEQLTEKDMQKIKNLLKYHQEKQIDEQTYKKWINFIQDIQKVYVLEENKSCFSNIRTFWAQMKSGKSCKLNLDKCIKGYIKHLSNDQNETDVVKTKVNKALRNQVDYQVQEFKQENNLMNTKLEADHVYPFDNLVLDFLKQENLDYNSLYQKLIYDNQRNVYLLNDETLTTKFDNYHKQNAKLQPLTRQENLSKLKK